MKQFVIDIESDGLLPEITKIHCLSYCNLNNPEDVKSLTNYKDIQKFILQEDIELIGHNLIMYDVPAMEKILGIKIKAKIIDTLPLAWYLEPTQRKRYGLEAFGEEFGVNKPYISDWSNLSLEEYCHRCETDVRINTILWNKQKRHLEQIYYNEEESLQKFIRYISFKMHCAQVQETLGFRLDVEHCEVMVKKLFLEKEEKIRQLTAAMPKVPQYKVKKYPRAIKVGDDIYTEGDMFFEMFRGQYKIESLELKTIKGYAEPNPSSSKQVKDWLYSLGWIPENIKHVRNKETNETKQIPQIASKEGGGEICNSIHKLFKKEPKLELLGGLSVLSHRISLFEGFLRDQRDGRIYGTIAGLTNTLRVKHSVIVNLPGLDKKYGNEVRASFLADEDKLLCGSDISGLEDSTKRHYIWKYDPAYVEEMNTPGYDPHFDIAVLAGMLTKEQVQAHKEGKENHTFTRYKSKVVNFSATYKIGAPALARNSGMKLSEAKKLLRIYWERNKAILDVERSLTTKTVNNQMWQKNPVNGYWYSLRNMKDQFSTLNQGTGSYVADIWLTYLEQLEIHVPFFYHDEVAFNIKPEDKEIIKDKVLKAMDMVNERLKLNIKIGCSVQFGESYNKIH